MGNFFIVIGSFVLVYLVLATLLGFPQLSDFLPVGIFDDKPEGEFYKIVKTEGPDKGLIIVNACSIALIFIGLAIKYFFK